MSQTITIHRAMPQPIAPQRLSPVLDAYDAKANALNPGDCMQMPYTQAKSCITYLRSLKDGRAWSLRALNNGSGDFGVWRLQ